MSDREEFEKWARSVHLDTGKFSHSNRYYSCETNGALEGWQARQPEIDALKADNNKLREAAENVNIKLDTLHRSKTPPDWIREEIRGLSAYLRAAIKEKK